MLILFLETKRHWVHILINCHILTSVFALPVSHAPPPSCHLDTLQVWDTCTPYGDCQARVNGQMKGYGTRCSTHLGELNRSNRPTTSRCLLTGQHSVFIFPRGEVTCVGHALASWEHVPNKPGSWAENMDFFFLLDLFHCCFKIKKDVGTPYQICAATKSPSVVAERTV